MPEKVLRLTIPGRAELALHHLVLDVNGTLALDGELEEGIAPRLARLRELLEVHLLTADTHGRQAALDALLGLCAHRLQPGGEAAQKEAFARALSGGVAAIGNGANDVGMLRAASLGVAVLGGEGLCREALLAADLVCRSGCEALDLLLNPARLRATLRA